MEDIEDAEKPSAFTMRSPTFNKYEVSVIVELVEQNKSVLLNKSTNSAVCDGKEAAWSKITKAFNSRGFSRDRETDCLRRKWENLKRLARKKTKNLKDIRYSEYDDLTSRVVALLCEADSLNAVTSSDPTLELEDDIIDMADSSDMKTTESRELWSSYAENQPSENDNTNNLEEEGEKSRLNRSMNFSPQECNRLLQCVKEEKKQVFSKETTAKAVRIKNQAWDRISEAFNRDNPNKRSTKVLRTKFENMKKMARSVAVSRGRKGHSRKQQRHKETGYNTVVKTEKDDADYSMDLKPTSPDGEDFDRLYDTQETNNHIDLSADPLSTVLNGYTDPMAENGYHSSRAPSDNKEVVKLKIELLKYKLETAKLKRQRVTAALEAESTEREARAAETALRLRAARLDVAAAELRLPPAHPAHHYPPTEMPAQRYLAQYPHS